VQKNSMQTGRNMLLKLAVDLQTKNSAMKQKRLSTWWKTVQVLLVSRDVNPQ
jgi:hypothetical protein